MDGEDLGTLNMGDYRKLGRSAGRVPQARVDAQVRGEQTGDPALAKIGLLKRSIDAPRLIPCPHSALCFLKPCSTLISLLAPVNLRTVGHPFVSMNSQ